MAKDNQPVSFEIEIDDNIETLVTALNSLPGISTNSSCGGHKNPEPSQAPAGEWYVDFNLLPHQLAWQSLELIAFAAGELFSRDGRVILTAWHDGGIRFELHGYNVAPNELVDVIHDNLAPMI